MSDTPSRETQRCCYDGELTADPVKVDEVHTAAGVGQDVIACPDHAHLYGVTAERRAS